jgi:methylase of polypeptide subunit release factors
MEREKAGIATHIMSGNSLADIGKLVQCSAFDIVISNPPYLSYYGNAPARMIETEKNSLLQNFELVDRSNQRINAMNLFIELGIKLLKDGGILAYVLNKTLCVLPSYRKTRAYILSNSTINQVIVDLDPFDAIVDCATLCLSKIKPPLDYTLNRCS